MGLSLNHSWFKNLEQGFKSQSKSYEHSKSIFNGLTILYWKEVTVKSYNDNTILKGLLHQFIKCIIKVYITSAICGRQN